MRTRHRIITSLLPAIGLLAGHAASQSVPPPTETVILTAAPPYSASGELFILKADTNTVGLCNPVLVVEGFDLDNSMGWDALYTLLNTEQLAEDMQAYGRDLLVLNFTDSTLDIFDNAALNETAIEYINAHRADPNDKFTAVGASLGGLTLRKALIDMPAHDVDTWISFDVPHEGANIPLGLQEYLEFFASYDDAAAGLLTILDRPAARQLLLTHHSHPDGLTDGSIPERADFQTAMDAMGYPTNCKTIAISNGSGFGEKYPFAPADHVIHWTGTTVSSGFNIDITSDIYALPQSQSTVFYAKLTTFFGLVTVDTATINAYHPLSFDNAPGGGRGTFLQLYTNIPPDQINGDDFCTQTNHCFVPTVSALGIPIDNMASNLAANAMLTALSPFDEIHYAVENEAHVEINPHNKRWLFRALLEDIDTDGDGLDDYGEYLVGTDYSLADSTLTTVIDITTQPTNGTVAISWNRFPNTQYEVWYTESLTNTWMLLETLAPSSDPTAMREYIPAQEIPDGFFLVIADPIDPVTD